LLLPQAKTLPEESLMRNLHTETRIIQAYVALFFVLLIGAPKAFSQTVQIDSAGNMILNGTVTAAGFASTGSGTGSWLANEGINPGTAASNKDLIYADSNFHGFMQANNGAASPSPVGTGVVICAQAVLTAITGTGSTQNVYNCTVPSSLFVVGRVLNVHVVSRHTTGSSSITYNWKLGGTAFSTYSATTTGSIVHDLWCIITGTNAETCTTNVAISGGASPVFVANSVLAGSTATEATGSASSISFQFNAANTDAVTPLMYLVMVY
jgi:hypothetical protein